MASRPSRLLGLLAGFVGIGLVLMVAGCGSGHSGSTSRGASRTVDLTMTDNAFQPTDVKVNQGETVRFRFTNQGTAVHEAYIGDQAGQDKHHRDMQAGGGKTAGTDAGGAMVHGHSADGSINEVSLDPGQTGELTYTFAGPGTVTIGCHVPGHWEQGMKTTVTIT